MKTYGEVEYTLHASLTSTLRDSEIVSRSGGFTSMEIFPGIHWMRDNVGHRAGLENAEKRRIYSLGVNGTPNHQFSSKWHSSYILNETKLKTS
jgi:hypothetical protein